MSREEIGEMIDQAIEEDNSIFQEEIENLTRVLNGDEEEEAITSEMLELPFKLIVPKGVHGTFSIHFSI